eukprot:TRINITY_DN1665_c0_g1_i1.p1 TRINITY_DN1665_c0_g1~~TRINITY_DN1665_c0_g1_i1.p1  ORF type:complete len:139 (-),score=40.97 TRINITY_DN1665_c0_g1_i1:27-443(-)
MSQPSSSSNSNVDSLTLPRKEVEYPKKDQGRDLRIWSPTLLLKRYGIDDTQNQTSTAPPAARLAKLPGEDEEYRKKYEEEYPKKELGRDPRIWSPSLLQKRYEERASAPPSLPKDKWYAAQDKTDEGKDTVKHLAPKL